MNIQFQIVSWYAEDAINGFTIYLFGRDLSGRTVCTRVEGYRPRFYLQSNVDFETLSSYLRRKTLTKIDDKWTSLLDGDDVLTVPVQEKAVNLWGFHNGKKEDFWELSFPTLETFKRVKNAFVYPKDDFDFAYKPFESGLEPVLRFAHDRNLQMSGFVNVKGRRPHIKKSTCELECVAGPEDVTPVTNCDSIAPLVEVAFDIEVFSHDGSFPSAKVPANVVFQIGATCKIFSKEETLKKYLFVLGPCEDIEQATVFRFNTEASLLKGFAAWIQKTDPDCIHHYNGDQFDWDYLFERAQRCGIMGTFSKISRLVNFSCTIENDKFSSGAYGDNEFRRVRIPGRLNLDLLIFVKRGNETYDNYKLDTIATYKLGEHKDPVTPKMILAAYASQNAHDVAVVGKYCIQDTVIVQKLSDKLTELTQMMEMSNITSVPVSYLYEKGQQIKVYSLIMKRAQQLGFRVPDNVDGKPGDATFKGALVIEPEVGSYWTPVAVLDFASLYPSIQMAYNICYSTLVMEAKYAKCLGVVYESISWKEDDGREMSFSYAQKTADGQPAVSVIPTLQRELVQARKAVKKERDMVVKPQLAALKEAKGSPAEIAELELKVRVLTGRELAIKVSMNSIYGFTSAFKLNCMSLAASVTAKGREMIERTKSFFEHEFEDLAKQQQWISSSTKLGLQVVAGDTDSCFVHFPHSSRAEAIGLAKKAEKVITDSIFNRPPIRIEYEKTFHPWFIEKKKCYIGQKFEDDPDKPVGTIYQGSAIKRRNYCKFTRDLLKQMADTFVTQGRAGQQEALQILTQRLELLVSRKCNVEDLQVSAKLAAKYKSDNLPHVQLARRLQARDAGSAPRVGERFFYVVIQGDGDISQRTEDPEYVKTHSIPIDALYYLEHQVINPILSFMRTLGLEAETKAIFARAQEPLLKEKEVVRRKAFQQRNGLQDIGDLMLKMNQVTVKSRNTLG